MRGEKLKDLRFLGNVVQNSFRKIELIHVLGSWKQLEAISSSTEKGILCHSKASERASETENFPLSLVREKQMNSKRNAVGAFQND